MPEQCGSMKYKDAKKTIRLCCTRSRWHKGIHRNNFHDFEWGWKYEPITRDEATDKDWKAAERWFVNLSVGGRLEAILDIWDLRNRPKD